VTAESPSPEPPVVSAPAGKRTRWAFAVATFFGIGRLKPGPGTWASIAAVLLWAIAARAVHLAPHALLAALCIGIALALLLGIPASTMAARESRIEDPGFVVVDEVIGQWIALLFCPSDWAHALIALVLFRLFDILKPPPARQLERLPAGWGIVLDDVAAGLYALGIASLVRIWY
jgi:phosphatidylglycerophosphatase A